jgi:hypothetical protein
LTCRDEADADGGPAWTDDKIAEAVEVSIATVDRGLDLR